MMPERCCGAAKVQASWDHVWACSKAELSLELGGDRRSGADESLPCTMTCDSTESKFNVRTKMRD